MNDEVKNNWTALVERIIKGTKLLRKNGNIAAIRTDSGHDRPNHATIYVHDRNRTSVAKIEKVLRKHMKSGTYAIVQI